MGESFVFCPARLDPRLDSRQFVLELSRESRLATDCQLTFEPYCRNDGILLAPSNKVNASWLWRMNIMILVMQCFRVLYCEVSHEWLDFGLGKCVHVCKENHVTSKGLNAPRYFFLSFRRPACFGHVIQIPPSKFFFCMTVAVFFGWDAVFACQGKS